jgi:hypothetical protein
LEDDHTKRNNFFAEKNEIKKKKFCVQLVVCLDDNIMSKNGWTHTCWLSVPLFQSLRNTHRIPVYTVRLFHVLCLYFTPKSNQHARFSQLVTMQ